MAAPQLLAATPSVDYLVFDYLAETTMAIMAKQRERKPTAGYATDFVDITMREIAPALAASGVKVISNAGGVNPLACKAALEEVLASLGVDLKVGVVLGDELLGRAGDFAAAREMFDDRAFPASPSSVNAYLGARPIAQLLARGCDIVISGRIVDSAVTLGACMHEFGWADDAHDALAGATLAGHIIECGAQGTGGLNTDWEAVADAGWTNIGYPIAEVQADGSFTVSKPAGTGGLVSAAGVAEQLLYEIGDPGAYHMPDVACDFTNVQLEAVQDAAAGGGDVVRVSGARGQPPTSTYKVTATYFEGYRADACLVITGADAGKKAARTAAALLGRQESMLAARGLPPYSETHVEVLGDEAQYGDANRTLAHSSREVVLRMSAKHSSKAALGLFAREFAPAATSMAPGTHALGGGRPTPSPVVRCFNFLIDKADVPVQIGLPDGQVEEVQVDLAGGFARSASESLPPQPSALAAGAADGGGPTTTVPLIAVCHGRSGDKGDTANIGIVARDPAHLPHLRAVLTEARVAGWFRHALAEGGKVTRYEVPGIGGFNFVLERALGGGGTASLRADSLAKAFCQQLLAMPVEVPAAWVAK